MATDKVRTYFFAKKAMKGCKVSPKEFIVLAGLSIGGSQSVQSLQRYCESNGHCWHYRNFKRMVDKLMAARLVSRYGKRIKIDPEGMLLVSFINRRMESVMAAAA